MRVMPALATVCLYLAFGGCSENAQPDSTNSASSIGGVIGSLKHLEKDIPQAKDTESEAKAIHSLWSWIRQHQKARIHPDRGSDLSCVVVVRELATGKNVTADVGESKGPMEADIVFSIDVDGKYQKIYEMRFIPRDKNNVMLLFLE